jgi:hypothetical protein
LAQSAGAAESATYDYTFAYFVVLLGVVLGLLCVLRPSGRRHEAGPEMYVLKNLLAEEK